MIDQVYMPHHVGDAIGDDLTSKLLSLIKEHEHRYGTRPTTCKLHKRLAFEMNNDTHPPQDFAIEGLDIEFLNKGDDRYVYLGREKTAEDDFFGFKAVLDVPTTETIVDYLTHRARNYFSNADLLDENMGRTFKKKKGKKAQKPLTPMQRAVQDFGGHWAIEDDHEVYYWKEVRLRFNMIDKCFRRI